MLALGSFVFIYFTILAENLDFTKKFRCNPGVTKIQTDSKSVSKAGYWSAVALLALAVLLHSYLASKHYGLKFGFDAGNSICNVNATFNCEAVSASRYAQFLGVPMAVWGALTNFLLMLLVLWHPFVDDTKKTVSRKNILLIAAGITVMSVIMGGISLLFMSTYCIFCMSLYLISFLVLGALYKGLAKETTADGTTADGTKVESKSAFSPLEFKTVVITGVVIFIGGFIVNDSVAKSYGSRELAAFVPAQVAEWQANPVLPLQTVEPLVMGADKDKAKMTIVEFADYRCPHCKHAAPVFRAFVLAHAKDVRFEFQAWPLDGECNTSMTSANGASCLLARTVYCAGQKGKGWEAHEWIYEHQEEFANVEAIRGKTPELCQAIGVTCPELLTCASSEQAKGVIEKQAALGTSMNVKGTPTVFVNNKLMMGAQILDVLQSAHASLGGD